ncbi:MAG: ABC transporter ATP-binding protein [Ardenticatenaceae bacterium]|nr:ABC transporter ATP-binding protein [Ardenticatenaceae bacterium]
MIEAFKLVKRFDDFTAVDDVSFTVKPGELIALLGPNGAGKTTTIRMLSAILKPTSGWAQIGGHDVNVESDKVRHRIGILTEQPGLYERMTGLEYLWFYGRLYGMRDEDITERGLSLFDRFQMPGAAHRRIGEYSKGMKQKTGLIRAMLHRPAVMMLDEPTSAMDPYSAKMVREAIEELRSDDRAIILCTHNLPEAERLADRIMIISHGRIVVQGTAAELKNKLLGSPKLELTLDRPLNGQLPDIHREFNTLIDIEEIVENQIVYRTNQPVETNPQLVRFLSGLGLGTVTLREVSQSLEEVYLRVVGGENA